MNRGASRSKEVERGDRQKGFLLVEVLATMTITALLLAALFSITSLALKTSARVERRTQLVEDRTRLLAALSREIERALPVRWAGKSGAFIFSGNERSLAFATERPAPDETSEITAVFIDGSGGIARRLAVVDPVTASFDALVIGKPETMAGARYKLSISYFARLADGREALVREWHDPTQFPIAILLTVSDRDGKSTSTRVKLSVDAEPGCGFVASGRCSLSPVENRDAASAAEVAGDE